ncbi:MAG: adenylate/guanylate cyclase domain-containing protein [Thermodesulfobacteriota bacterium]
MIDNRLFTASILVRSVAAINMLGNLLGVVLTFVYFAVLIPRLEYGAPTGSLGSRMGFFLAVVGFVLVFVVPINTRFIWPLVREAKQRLGRDHQDLRESEDMEDLKRLTGKLMKLPVKLAGTNLAAWVIAALVVSAWSHAAPDLYPWPHAASHKISAWMILVAAPITMLCIYFAQERWLRLKIPALFPAEALESVPPAFRINVLPRLLAVSLVIGCLPLTLVSHLALKQIHDIKAGQQSLDNFLMYMPDMIWFVLGVFGIVAVGLAVFLAKSVSEPLQSFESAMTAVRKGDLDTHVPVVSNDEIGHMGEGFNQMIRDLKEADTVKDTFGRYLSREVVDEILKSPGGVELKGELRDISVLVSDLREFTRLTEALEPRQVLQIINRYLETMTEIIVAHKGTIDEFTGDGILVFFGAPQALQDHCVRAVRCALDMQRAMEELNVQLAQRALPELRMGIGINCGQLIVGNIGSEKRKKYGALGSPINLAFRIESQTAGGEVLVSPEVHTHLNGRLLVDQTRECLLKGLEDPITLYRVVGLHA